MTTVSILAFGITREILGEHRISLALPASATIADLRSLLVERYPALRELASLLIAQDADLAEDSDSVRPGSELALIPPVSGG